jgi:hypothetical protein
MVQAGNEILTDKADIWKNIISWDNCRGTLAEGTARGMPPCVLDYLQMIIFAMLIAADRGQEVNNSRRNTESLDGIGGKQKVIVHKKK